MTITTIGKLLGEVRNSQKRFGEILTERHDIMSELTPELVSQYISALEERKDTPQQQYDNLLEAYHTLEEWWLMRVEKNDISSPFFLDARAERVLQDELFQATKGIIARMKELVEKKGVPCARSLCKTGRDIRFCKICDCHLC